MSVQYWDTFAGSTSQTPMAVTFSTTDIAYQGVLTVAVRPKAEVHDRPLSEGRGLYRSA